MLAIPPSIWREVIFSTDNPLKFDSRRLKPLKPQMGNNVKCLMSFPSSTGRNRVSPILLPMNRSNLPGMRQEQFGHGHVLVGFSGADKAPYMREMENPPIGRKTIFAELLGLIPAQAMSSSMRVLTTGPRPVCPCILCFPVPKEVLRCGPVSMKASEVSISPRAYLLCLRRLL